MSIQCQKCAYLMTLCEAIGYGLGKLSDIAINQVLPAYLELVKMRNKMGQQCDHATRQVATGRCCAGFELAVMGILNQQKIECHVCREYTGWSLIKDKERD